MGSLQWGVDLDGIGDIDLDVGYADCDKWGLDPFAEPFAIDSIGQEFSSGEPVGVPGGGGGDGGGILPAMERVSIPSLPIPVDSVSAEGVEEVVVLSPTSLQEAFHERMKAAPVLPNPFDLCQVYDTSEGEEAMKKTFFIGEDSNHVLKAFFRDIHSSPVYFLLRQVPSSKATGRDVVKAVIRHAFRRSREVFGYSSDETQYQLFSANSEGEWKTELELQDPIGDIRFFSVFPFGPRISHPIDAAPGLLPTTAFDIRLSVRVRDVCSNKIWVYDCVVPADMLAAGLEGMIRSLLPGLIFEDGTFRIVYGDSEYLPWEEADFSAWMGYGTGTIGQQTVLTLYRCGVRYVEIDGTAAQSNPIERKGETLLSFPPYISSLMTEEEKKEK